MRPVKALLHTCCAPCFLHPNRALEELGYDVTGYFYNPNIHPYREFKKRVGAVRQLVEDQDMDIVMEKDYGLDQYMERVYPVIKKGWPRCLECYRLRLERTAQYAKEHGFDVFTTTLLVSPYQEQHIIEKAGLDAARKHDVVYLHQDFSQGYGQAHGEAKEMGLYTQGYCGCVWSEWERYRKK